MPSTPLAPAEWSVADEPSPEPPAPLDDRLPPSPLALVGFECSLASTSLEGLERLARALDRRWLGERFGELGRTEEAALLATCCRRELVLLCRSTADVDRWRAVLPGPSTAWRVRLGRDVARHLFRVAGGRESLVVGEKEVRLQVRAAGGATLSRHRHRALRDLLNAAADAADREAPNVPTSRSIAAVAATRALELCGRPFPRVLVVGAGAVGRQVTELLSPSARVTLAFHQRPPSAEFLRSSGARAVRADALAAEIALSDVVVTAAKTGGPCLGLSDLPRARPLVLIDLGVPRNVDPDVRRIPSVRLVDLGELRSLARPDEDPALEKALDESADRGFDRLEALALEPWVAKTRRRAEEVRASELAVARRFLGALTPEQEVAVERLTRRLVDRLLLAPTKRLRAIPPGEDGDYLRRFALELLRPEPARP